MDLLPACTKIMTIDDFCILGRNHTEQDMSNTMGTGLCLHIIFQRNIWREVVPLLKPNQLLEFWSLTKTFEWGGNDKMLEVTLLGFKL